jgi:hypothetical protein
MVEEEGEQEQPRKCHHFMPIKAYIKRKVHTWEGPKLNNVEKFRNRIAEKRKFSSYDL